MHKNFAQSAGKILADLEKILATAHSPDFKCSFRPLQAGRSPAFALYAEEEGTWFSDNNDETLENLSGSIDTIFLEGMDTFINNTRILEIPGVFKGNHFLNSGTIVGSIGAESKQANT